MFDDKAQLHTLEGVAAATLILLVIIYAIDATSMTPLTSSTASAHMESELRLLGQGILDTLDYSEPGYNSKLKNDIIGWNGTKYTWNGGNYVENSGEGSGNLVNNLTGVLRPVLVNNSIAHNVELTYLDSSNGVITTNNRYMIYNGDPSDNAVIVSRKIVLHNSDINESLYSVKNPIHDIDPSTNLGNIVDVKIILWRR